MSEIEQKQTRWLYNWLFFVLGILITGVGSYIMVGEKLADIGSRLKAFEAVTEQRILTIERDIEDRKKENKELEGRVNKNEKDIIEIKNKIEK